VARLEDPLPQGSFDLVFSALAIHHLDGSAKADLFARVAAVVAPGGRFVIGDVVTPLSAGYAMPSTVAEQPRLAGRRRVRRVAELGGPRTRRDRR
jgi:SAM-dependent methyltransferase